MVSRLDPPLPSTPTRQTEAADARLALRRDESKSLKRDEGGAAGKTYTPIEWEDVSSVSVAALRVFLQTLLETGPSAMESPSISAAPPPHSPSSGAEPQSGLTARALGAYQSVGRAVHDHNIAPPSPPSLPPHTDHLVLGHDISEADREKLSRFISDLIELERRGVVELTMQRNLTFIDSIEAAIKVAKAGISR